MTPDQLSSHIPLTTTGGFLDDTPGTVSHVWFDGAGLRDTKGNVWTQNGTVPQVATSPLLYDGQHMRAGAGPFTAGYYSIPTAGLFDMTGDFTGTIIGYFPQAVGGTYYGLFTNDPARASGWYIEISAGGPLFVAEPGGVPNNYTELPPAPPGLIAFSFGRAGSTGWLVTTYGQASFPWGTISTGAATSTLGVIGGTGGDVTPGYIYEFQITTETPTPTAMQAKLNRVLGQLTAENQPVTVTR